MLDRNFIFDRDDSSFYTEEPNESGEDDQFGDSTYLESYNPTSVELISLIEDLFDENEKLKDEAHSIHKYNHEEVEKKALKITESKLLMLGGNWTERFLTTREGVRLQHKTLFRQVKLKNGFISHEKLEFYEEIN